MGICALFSVICLPPAPHEGSQFYFPSLGGDGIHRHRVPIALVDRDTEKWDNTGLCANCNVGVQLLP